MLVLDILLVEDNPSDAEYISYNLEEVRNKGRYKDIQIHTDWAKTLTEGIEILQNKNFDLIMLDLSLPDSHGVETIRKLNDFDIPIIVLTGDISGTLWMDAIQEGAEDYLTKNNIDQEVLLRTIGHSIERFKLRLELKNSIKQLDIYSKKLIASNKDLEQFAYAASHDLQEPLRTIVGFTERIADYYADRLDERGKDFLKRIEKAGHRMQKLLDDLLEYSRLNSRNLEQHKIEMGKVFFDIAADLEQKILKTKTSINLIHNNENFELCKLGTINQKFIHQCRTLPVIEANTTQICRLFENVISNSIKYSKRDVSPIITIKSDSSKTDKWIVEIEDNGIGFEEEYKDKIFQQFKRLHGTAEYEGTGMGLAAVKKIAESYSGTVYASSQVGIGSCFTVELPYYQGSLVH